MKTVRRLLYRDIVSSVGFVALAFLSLFFFIDFVDDLEDVGKDGYTVVQATLHSLYEVPAHAYELMPIAVLIGAIYAMARLAQSSEFTILRTGGLGPGRALTLLAGLGVAFAAATFVIGDYVTPWSERQSVVVQTLHRGALELGRNGAWLKDRRDTPQGSVNVSVNVGGAAPGGHLTDVRIYEFNEQGALVQRLTAARVRIGNDGTWTLEDVLRTHWDRPGEVPEDSLKSLDWPTTLDAGVVAAAVLPLSTMSTVELWRYTTHLADNEQAAQRHEIQFWKKALYPLACLVMIGLALPFAYLHARGGGISWKVFGGIMLGISFVLLNNVASHIGVLANWTPWLVASAPSALYLLLSLAAFSWLVRYR